jgi:phage terminase small subunit
MASKKTTPDPDDGLTDRQRRFVFEYLLDLNGVAAYKRAGYKGKTYDAVKSGASEILANPYVLEAIRKGEQEQIEQAKIRNWEVLREARIIATSDVTRFVVDEEGRISDPDNPLGTRAISSTEAEFEYVPEPEQEEQKEEDRPKKKVKPARKLRRMAKKQKIRLWDKNAALKLLAQHAGLIDSKDAKDMLEKFLDSLRPDVRESVLRRHADAVGRGPTDAPAGGTAAE